MILLLIRRLNIQFSFKCSSLQTTLPVCMVKFKTESFEILKMTKIMNLAVVVVVEEDEQDIPAQHIRFRCLHLPSLAAT